MHSRPRIVAATLAIVLFSSTLALAQAPKAADKPSGTVIAVDAAVVQIKGTDGKTYQVKVADVIEKNLKTGDMVEYEVVEGRPVKVTKKK
jgi:hypothetical protein